ncbi:MAG TPA: metallophosphoesterase family protein [Polyangiaceae bacterium]|jgi:putative phosphoesterase|nr:metallophosphoesterase family protein [Polyangiaceae bacterium]
MRLALVSDIHGNLPALEAVVKDFGARGVDGVVNLGDSLSGPLFPLATAQFLMAQSWVHLAGNHERWILKTPPAKQKPSDAFARAELGSEQLEWLSSLLPCQPLSSDVLLCHGTPTSDLEYLLETVDERGMRLASAEEISMRLGDHAHPVVVCGHSHIPRIARSRLGQLLVNPGSVGLPAFEADWPHPHRAETGSPDARYAIVEQRAGAWQAELVAVPYDHAAVARVARERGRTEWELALLTGYARSEPPKTPEAPSALT